MEQQSISSDDNNADREPDDITTRTYDANGNRLTASSEYGVDITNGTYTNVGSAISSTGPR